jgi:hypothetical protein
MGYALRFRVVWVCFLVVLPLLILGSSVALISLLADRFEAAGPGDDARLAVGVVAVVLLASCWIALMWYVGMFCETVLVRVRAIDPLLCCCRDSHTHSFGTVAELQTFLRQRVRSFKRGDVESGERNGMLATVPYVTPVGGGWSFYLAKSPVRGPCVVLDGLSGPCGYCRPNDTPGSVRYFSGTTLDEMLRDLARRKLTLASTPSHGTITIGGWIGGCAHGSGGTLWTPTTGRVTVLDQATGEQHDVSYDDRKRHFGMSRYVMRPQYIITEVEVLPMEDVWTQLAVRRMTSEDEAYWWLVERSRLRCIFTGKRGSMMMLWLDAKAPRPHRCCARNEHVDPHCCSRECRYFQADLLSVLQPALRAGAEWFDWPTEPQRNWDGKTPLSNANKFSPTISALAMAIATFFCNFEVFVRVSEAQMTPVLLTALLRRLQRYHVAHGGRTETRFGVYNGNGKLFLDFSTPYNARAISEALRVLEYTFGRDRKMAFHPGKFVPPIELSSPHVRVVAVSVL